MEFHYLFLFALGCFVESSVLRHNFGIYGGHPINITEAPFMAFFSLAKIEADCGASIVHEQFVLTAAHCTISKRNYSMHVTVGTDNVNSGETYEVEHVFVHPKYSFDTFDYDLAVVKLKNKLKWSDKVKRIEMTDTHSFDTIKNGDLLTTMGFGQTESHDFSSILLSVDVPFVDRSTCKKLVDIDDCCPVTSRMLCAGGEKGKGGCASDGGGPIIYQGKLAGAVSWGIDGCGLFGKPWVFAYLPAMRDFVDNIIKNN